MGQGKLDIYLIDTVFLMEENFIGECSVKVGGKQSSMRFANFGSWGKKPRVAPDSSDLSSRWLIKCEDSSWSKAKVYIYD